MLGQKVTPLEKVGVYVPGGKAVYPSSVLMNIMPAKVAGVDKIIMTTHVMQKEKSIRQFLSLQKRQAQMKYTKQAVHRRLQPLHLEQKASRK